MLHPWRSPAPILACLTLLAGCEDTPKNARNSGSCTDLNGLQTCRRSDGTNSDGTMTIDINVNGTAGAFLLTTRGEADHYLSVEEVIDPDGNIVLAWQDWYSGEYHLTAGVLPFSNEMQLNWPVRAEDPQLSDGWWSVVVAAIDYEGYYQRNASIDLTTQVKQDTSFSDGIVNVRIVYVDGLDGDPNVTGATEEAVEIWRTIWAAYGLSLSIDYDVRSDISADLPAMSDGSADIDDISAGGTDADISVIIGDTVGGTTSVYGESGGIPGTLVEGEHSAVAISWITNAGGDGTFSSDDIQIYGETLAHEVGHYMGLFHPVDYDGRTPYSWDALDDTDECTSMNDCDAALGENNMYPFPVCPDFNSCLPQQTLSDGQTGVLHRHTGTL